MNCRCPIYRYDVPEELWRRVVPPHSRNVSLHAFVEMAEDLDIKIYGSHRRPERPFRSGSGWMLEHPFSPYYELTTFWPSVEPCPLPAITPVGPTLVR